MNLDLLDPYLIIGCGSVLFELVTQLRMRRGGLNFSDPSPAFWFAQLFGWPIECVGLLFYWAGYPKVLADYYKAIGAPRLLSHCPTCTTELCDECGHCHQCSGPHEADGPEAFQ